MNNLNIKHESFLRMDSLIVKRFNFLRVPDVKDGSKIDVDITHNVQFDGEEIRAELGCSLVNEAFSLDVTFEGRFTEESEKNESDFPVEQLKANVLAIMFPFLRSQVAIFNCSTGFQALNVANVKYQ